MGLVGSIVRYIRSYRWILWTFVKGKPPTKFLQTIDNIIFYCVSENLPGYCDNFLKMTREMLSPEFSFHHPKDIQGHNDQQVCNAGALFRREPECKTTSIKPALKPRANDNFRCKAPKKEQRPNENTYEVNMPLSHRYIPTQESWGAP